MLIINTFSDIQVIKQAGVIHSALIEELEKYFKELVQNLTENEKAWNCYNLEEDGSIVILQPDIDDPSNIEEFGFNKENGGLFEAPIEFVSLIELDNVTFFKITIVLNNSCCIVIFSEKGKFCEEFNQLLSQFLID